MLPVLNWILKQNDEGHAYHPQLTMDRSCPQSPDELTFMVSSYLSCFSEAWTRPSVMKIITRSCSKSYFSISSRTFRDRSNISNCSYARSNPTDKSVCLPLNSFRSNIIFSSKLARFSRITSFAKILDSKMDDFDIFF